MAVKTQPVKIDVRAHAHLKTLAKKLQSRGFPQKVENQDMLSALVLHTTVPQLAGMLTEYWRNTADLEAKAGDSG